MRRHQLSTEDACVAATRSLRQTQALGDVLPLLGHRVTYLRVNLCDTNRIFSKSNPGDCVLAAAGMCARCRIGRTRTCQTGTRGTTHSPASAHTPHALGFRNPMLYDPPDPPGRVLGHTQTDSNYCPHRPPRSSFGTQTDRQYHYMGEELGNYVHQN